MIIDDILTALKTNAELMTLIGGNICAHNSPSKLALVYSFTPVSDNKIKRVDRFEAHMIADNLLTLYTIDNFIREILLTIGDNSFSRKILSIEINGGGDLEDLVTGTYHKIVYFQIESRH